MLWRLRFVYGHGHGHGWSTGHLQIQEWPGQKSMCDSALCLKSENGISVEVKVFEPEKEEYKPEG